jgi:hypothetical protein
MSSPLDKLTSTASRLPGQRLGPAGYRFKLESRIVTPRRLLVVFAGIVVFFVVQLYSLGLGKHPVWSSNQFPIFSDNTRI